MKFQIHLIFVGIFSITFVTRALASKEEIAIFPNTPEGWAKEGRRIDEIFTSNKIAWRGSGSRGFGVDVDSSDAFKARSLLAGAIIIENLHITLYKRDSSVSGRAVVTPKEALYSYKAIQAEQGAAANP